MISVKLPDGSTAQFPDGTPPATIKAAIQKKFPPKMASAPGTSDHALAPSVSGNVPPQQPSQSIGDMLSAGFTSGVNALPIVGPSVLGGLEGLKGMVQGRPQSDVAATDQSQVQANPTPSTVGAIAGTILPFVAGGEIPGVAKLLGMDASVGLIPRTLASAASQGAITYADNLARGGTPTEAAPGAGIAAGVGALLPGAGLLASKTIEAIPKIANWSLGGLPGVLRNASNTDAAAQRAVGRSFQADIANGTALAPSLQASANSAGQNVINLDRGGPATRTLARISSSASPEAKGILANATDRGAPGIDTANFVTKLVGGSADDLGLRQGLRDASRLANGPAYKRAYSAPAAKSIWTSDIANMFQSSEFKKAVQEAEGIGRTRAAAQGGTAVRNPFVFQPDGSVTMKAGVTPSLEFWDKVKIGLDRQIEGLGPKERTAAADLTALKQKLVGVLDNAVPAYKTARAGAAQFFGAEDAMDAGRQFAVQPRNLPEATKAYAKFSDPEKKAFAIGAASSVVDKLKSGNDSFAVVKQTFGNQASRDFWHMTLGAPKAQQLESYVKVQAIMDGSKNAINGGSHTYDLMAAAGIGGAGAAGSYFAPGNNFSSAAYFLAALRAGRGVLGRGVDQAVAEKVANLLASNDPKALNKVIANAGMSKSWRDAVDAIYNGISGGIRGTAVSAARPQVVQ